MSSSQKTSFASERTHCVLRDCRSIVCNNLAVMAGIRVSFSTALQPHCRLDTRHQFSCAGICAGARRPVPISSVAHHTTAQFTYFAAAVTPDVAEEGASQTSEHTNNRATTQHSSGASHVESCYPTKTINCSDGTLPFGLSSRLDSRQCCTCQS